MRRTVLLVASIAALAALPASAHAATPIDLALGAGAHVAVDGAGAGHVTYAENQSGQAVTHYCLLPAEATACAAGSRTFIYPQGANFGSSSGVWPLLPGDRRVLIVDARCCV